MNSAETQNDHRFTLKDCALIALATIRRANNLKEMRDHIAELSEESLYYHFWGNLLLQRFEEREYNNDFASWIRHGMHDSKLVEQLSVLDPTAFNNLKELRQRLLKYIDDRLEESEYLQWSRATQQFEFVESQIVVFDTHTRFAHPNEMASNIQNMSISSIFYHFIDARRRTHEKVDDFRLWLGFFGEHNQPLIDCLSSIDPYFTTLPELRLELASTFQNFFAENNQ